MPRPGHRPYECVRRAWHSDRHQPMRGSLIQEIFRVVHEIHSSATKKNKEWQEKLPIVVLKAEEIMYSKANSEAEYMDLETLWDRANDAIKTIIRLDETTETGVFLQPCIEAALNLGCTPRRASRSQRNSTPSYYLSPSSPDPIFVHSSNLQKTTQGNHRTSNLFMSTYLNFMRSTTMSFTRLGVASQSPAVYPLYYGDHLQSKGPAFSFDTPSKLNSHSLEPAELGVMQNLPSCKTNALSKITQADIIDTAENSHETGCDLSLRLGCLGVPCKAIENSIPKEVENVSSRTPQEGNKMSDSSPQIGKKPFFHKSCSGDPVDTSPSNWTSETEILNVKKSMRKRKAVFDHLCDDKQFFWHPKLPFNNLTGWTSNAEP